MRQALEAALGRELYIPTMIEQMVDGYGSQIADPSTYQSMLSTNSALAGVCDMLCGFWCKTHCPQVCFIP